MDIVTLEYYKENFRRGSAPPIPDNDFLFVAGEAFDIMNYNRVTIEEPTDDMKKCICRVAERLYAQAESSKIGAVASFSNDGYSVTYQDLKAAADEIRSEIRGIVSDSLRGTAYHNDFVYLGTR